ncbi:hypothetical protein STEG23_022201 [Scotinomys teguina]
MANTERLICGDFYIPQLDIRLLPDSTMLPTHEVPISTLTAVQVFEHTGVPFGHVKNDLRQVLRASRHQLEKVNLANDMKILQGGIIAGKLQRALAMISVLTLLETEILTGCHVFRDLPDTMHSGFIWLWDEWMNGKV